MMRRSLVAIALFVGGALPAAAQTPAEAQPATIVSQDYSIGALFVDLWHDLPHIADTSNLFILGAGGTAALAVHESEASIGTRAQNSDELGELFKRASYPGSGWVQIGGAIGTYVVGRVTGNAKASSVGTDLIQAQLLDGVLVTGIKYASQRTRPDGGEHSFPSGHTSSIFASAAVLSRHFSWKAAIPAYGVASYVAASRVQENHHYISDVVFGAALGIVSGRTVTVRSGATQFRVAPSIVHGGAGVFFTRIN